MISNVFKGIIAILLVVVLVFLKRLTESVDRVGEKIPAIKVHTCGEVANMRRNYDRDSVKSFIEEETIFRVRGDIDVANNEYSPIPVEVINR